MCQRIFRPVCASDGVKFISIDMRMVRIQMLIRNIKATYTNECEVRAKACTHRIGLVVVKQVRSITMRTQMLQKLLRF